VQTTTLLPQCDFSLDPRQKQACFVQGLLQQETSCTVVLKSHHDTKTAARVELAIPPKARVEEPCLEMKQGGAAFSVQQLGKQATGFFSSPAFI